MKKMNAAVLTEYGKIVWMETDKPEIRQDEVLIKVSYAGIWGAGKVGQSILQAVRTKTGNTLKGTLKPDAMVSDIVHPSEAQKAFEMLENEPAGHLKILLKFQ